MTDDATSSIWQLLCDPLHRPPLLEDQRAGVCVIGAGLAGLRAAYASALRKLARINKDDPDPHPLEVFLFHSHPPIRQRLALADE